MTNIIQKSSKKDPFKFIEPVQESDPTPSIMQKETKMYRQGDILFKKIQELPINLKERENKVVAEGEVTGHAHVLENGVLFELLNSEQLYVKANESTKIIHNEHFPIKLEPGNYQIIRQREYLGKGIGRLIVRQVID